MSDQFVPVLYILMRTDMGSLNPGKACAQAAHAANMFIWQSIQESKNGDVSEHPGSVDDWINQTTQGFGTTIVLAVPDEQALTQYICAYDVQGFSTGIVHDPTYPVADGRITHLIPVNTCGYIFAPNKDAEALDYLKLLDLY